MATLQTRRLKKSLKKKGFKKDKTHHLMFWFYAGGKKTSVRTRVSHSKPEYDDNLTGLVAKQLKLSKEDLLRFVDCALNYETYLQLLIDNGHVTLDTDNEK